MVKEIAQNIFLIEVPLPNSPLKNLNSYLIRGGPRNLLIDTGFNRKSCYDALLSGLAEIQVDMEQTDIFLTHHHADHSGLCQRIASKNSKIYVSGPDQCNLMKMHDGTIKESMREIFWSYGLPEDILTQNISSNPAFLYRPEGFIDYTLIDEDTIFDLGQYRLRVLSTPGHTPGHCCLYDEYRKILFSGDHIIFGITPNITAWAETKDSLGDYLNSLKKVYAMDVYMTFSAHRASIGDCKKRIKELLMHHEHRLGEVLEIVKVKSNSTAYEVASQMTWSIRANSWGEFPPAQKWFATGEAVSHLEHLFCQNHIARSVVEGRLVYSLSRGHERER